VHHVIGSEIPQPELPFIPKGAVIGVSLFYLAIMGISAELFAAKDFYFGFLILNA
jgi:hypothetical protein